MALANAFEPTPRTELRRVAWAHERDREPRALRPRLDCETILPVRELRELAARTCATLPLLALRRTRQLEVFEHEYRVGRSPRAELLRTAAREVARPIRLRPPQPFENAAHAAR